MRPRSVLTVPAGLPAVLAAVAALLVAAPLTHAAPPASTDEPAEGVLVAGPPEPELAPEAPEDEVYPEPPYPEDVPAGEPARLYAGRWGRTLCIAFDRFGARPEEKLDDGGFSGGGPARTCGHLPREDPDAPFVLRIGGDAGTAGDDDGFERPQPPEGEADVGIAVRPEVAAVELQGPGRRTVRLATVAAPPALAGTPAGELRYVLGRAPDDVRTWRLLNAAGTVLHEADGNTFHDVEGRLVRGPVRVAAGGRGKAAWRITAEIRSVLAPLAGQPGRRVRSLCYELERGSPDGERSPDCAPLPLEEPWVAPAAGCRDGTPNLIAGLAPAGDIPRAVVATDGRRVPVRTFALPAAFGAGDVRAVIAVAPDGSGIRAGFGGPDLAPTQLTECHMASTSIYGYDRSVAGQPELGGDAVVRAAGPAGPRVFVRDVGEELCVAVERPVREGDCWEPSPALADARILPVAGGRMVAGTVNARIARVRIRLSTGAVTEVPTARDPAYAGRYAPHVAFLGYVAPAGTIVERVQPIGPRGGVLRDVLPTLPLLRGPAERRGVVAIRGVRRTVATAPWAFGQACVFLTSGPLPGEGDPCPVARSPVYALALQAPCGKAAVVGGTVEGPARRLEAVLADGRRIGARVVRIDRKTGVAYVTLPRSAALRRVEVRGRRGRLLQRYPATAPAADAHCGYETVLPSGPLRVGVGREG